MSSSTPSISIAAEARSLTKHDLPLLARSCADAVSLQMISPADSAIYLATPQSSAPQMLHTQRRILNVHATAPTDKTKRQGQQRIHTEANCNHLICGNVRLINPSTIFDSNSATSVRSRSNPQRETLCKNADEHIDKVRAQPHARAAAVNVSSNASVMIRCRRRPQIPPVTK